MKSQKKELSENIFESLRDKLNETTGQPEKLKKLIKKMAKKLAEKVVRVTVKQDKKLKKAKEVPDSGLKTGKVKKQKIKKGLKGVDTTERESLSIEKVSKEKKKK